ncbi:MAG: hypothetical protein GWM87_12580 [Xanthomonadales bacterium]|nr:hypothetical protein [Xanthomonadales bacterium]NIX13675.1 hypothetical protein [Xanthomonadales bacterium]
MKWLENNPLGTALAAVCGALILTSSVLVFVWSLPAPTGDTRSDAAGVSADPATDLANELGPVSQYRVVTERPVFDESRRPAVTLDDEGMEVTDDSGLVAGAPDVKLTGVVITPDYRIVNLTPLNRGEPLVVHEGERLGGEFSGWSVTDIEPRKVVLSSLDGDSLELDLEVSTRKIEPPPEPEPQPTPTDNTGQQANAVGEEEPLSRAEEIRQRIAERREELRREQEARQAGEANQRTRYQEAIQGMMQRPKQEEDSGG